LEGQHAVTPVLQQRQSLRYNMLRVWTWYDGGINNDFYWQIGRLVPAEHSDYWHKLEDFTGLCANYGMYIDFTAFIGQQGGPASPAMHEHWQRLGTVLPDKTNTLVELINENNAHRDQIDTNAFGPLPGVICSRGSNGRENPPCRPWYSGGYETLHYNDAFEWWRKVGHNSMEWSVGAEGLVASHVPALANENTRHPDRSTSLEHAYDAAAAAALLCGGSCFHSVEGKRSHLWSGVELECAKAWSDGAHSVNLNFQSGYYVREDPGQYLRVYSRVVGGQRETVYIRK
jgi:hypothetical protein